MRIYGAEESISYNDTREFFSKRAKKYKEDTPYSVTMLQDDHPELVKARNENETRKIIPLMRLNSDSKVLDVACGVGRWSDAITIDISRYCGVDFCGELIALANQRNANEQNRVFYAGSSVELTKVLKANNEGLFNRVLLIAALLYINDSGVLSTLLQIEENCAEKAIVCIREPIGVEKRLTLKDNYSEELNDYYNAIYRTRDELYEMIEKAFLSKGFVIKEEDVLFKESNLNNRKETTQYYFVLER